MNKVVFLLLLIILCLSKNITQAQVGIGTISPNPSAMLEIKSNSLGLLPPRMTTVQRDSIINPAEGLVVYNTDTKCLEWYIGSYWNCLCYNSVGTINCSNSSVNGSYQPSISLASFNYLRFEVVVSQVGSWNITTNIENGCWFQGSGVFTSTGTQIITLLGYGIPFTSGSFIYITILGTSFCSFNVNVALNANVCGSTILDVDGNSYNTIAIGTQCWMKENLKTSKYNNGSAIPNVTDNHWGTLTTGAWCNYNNNVSYNANYGKLYNYYAVNSVNGLCPTGWHVPSDAEWTTLVSYYGGESVAGGKLKETGTTHWSSPNTGATNSSGFTSLPGGWLNNSNDFEFIGNQGSWWSSTEKDHGKAWFYEAKKDDDDMDRHDVNKSNGMSIRCLRD